MSEDYKVGKGKPPKHSQYKKGQSGNPKGRPKGSKNFSADLKDTLKEPVALKKDGKRKNVSTQKAALFRLREKALAGDARALDKLLDLARTYNDAELVEATAALGLTDADIINAHNQRVLRRKAEPANRKERPDDGAQDTHAGSEVGERVKSGDKTMEDDDDDSWLC